MPSLLIRAHRMELSKSFPLAGFTVRTGESPSWFEVVLATDPALFHRDARSKRTHANFYSTRGVGPLPAERGEAVYLVPPQVLSRFAGQELLYYTVAAYATPDRREPKIPNLAPEALASIHISRSFTGRALRQMIGVPNPRGGLTGNEYSNGNGQSLEWAGDTVRPGVEPAPSPGGPAGGPPAAPGAPVAAQPAAPVAAQAGSGVDVAYDDGFGPMPEPRGADTDADPGIEGPIPDDIAAQTSALTFSRAMAAPEYSLATRYVQAKWFRTPAAPRTINRVVIHITDGGANINGTIGWFQNPLNQDGTPRKVSAHYIVGRDGEVVQMVKHSDVAFHASSANGDSIGIEHNANTRGLNPTEAQYCASAALVRWLCDELAIPIDRTHILGHAEADPSTTHRGCPNAVWDWNYYMGLVTSASCYPRESPSSAATAPAALAANGCTPVDRAPVRAAAVPLTYSRALAFAPFGGADVERMRAEFQANVAAGSPQSCIVITNAALRKLYGDKLKNQDGSNRRLGTTCQDTMAMLQGYGLAQSESVFEFNDSSGRLTRGTRRPESLQNSVEAWLLAEAEKNAMSAWYVFGLSIMDGYHTVMLALSFSGTADRNTRLFWADQIYSGWDDITGRLDARLTERTQTWWDPLPQDRKARTRVTVWPLAPVSESSTAPSTGQALAVVPSRIRARHYALTAPAVQDDGIEQYEDDSSAELAQGLSGSDCDALVNCESFCPAARADTAASAHFRLSEFHSRDGVEVPAPFRGHVQRVMDNLEVLRSELGDRPITVFSGFRSCAHNCRVGGAGRSRHLCGQAADIRVADVAPATVHATIERLIEEGRMTQGGLGLYNSFVHYDVRGNRARWDRTTPARAGSIAQSVFAAPLGPAPGSNPGSTKAGAITEASTFAGLSGITSAFPSLAQAAVASRLTDLINDPSLVEQGRLNLCGPAAFFHVLLGRDPVTFAQYTSAMFQNGDAWLGGLHVKAGSDLRNQTYRSGWGSPSTDWMTMSALRDSENAILDYEGTPEETTSAATTPEELAEWFEKTGLYRSVSNEGNWVFTKGISHATGLTPRSTNDIALLINAHILGRAAATRKKSDEFILSAFPNHFVVLRTPIVERSGNIEFQCWTWGGTYSVAVPSATFDANYYGAVIGEI